MNEGFDWKRTAGDLLSTGLSYFQPKQQVQAPKPAAPPVQDKSWVKWAIGGGAVLLVVIVAAFALRKGK